jgi:serine/threonine-protein kinase
MVASAIQNEQMSTVGRLEDRFQLGELLGEGSMGQVFAARDMLLDIEVAVKVMHPALTTSRRQVAHFTAEASISARMLSPHIVKVLGIAVTSEGTPCIIYELLHGETLGQRLARDGGVSLADTIEIVKQTSRALARAHQIGVVHRDVKPDNIFLTTDARGRIHVKLLDFGIAVVADKSGVYSQTVVAGTPEYMAPEVIFGTHDLDHRADLYALGSVAFECLTGRCPFPGDVSEVIEQLKSGTLAGFTDSRPDLAGPLDAWIDRAIHPNPYWRFRSAKELSDTFETAAAPVARNATQAARISVREAA